MEKKEIKQDQTAIFLNLQEDTPSDEIESLCMNCEKNGITKFLFTRIPCFKEIILSSFYCENCGFKNTEVQFGGKLEPLALKYTLNVLNEIQMNRQVVKSEYASIKIPELELEIPKQTQKGSINTIEGFIMKTMEGLQTNQEQRRSIDKEGAEKIDQFIQKLQEYIDGKHFPFTFIVEDPSGNSFIQNPNAPNKDNYLTIEQFQRTPEQYLEMGYNPDQIEEEKKEVEHKKNIPKSQTKEEQEELINKLNNLGQNQQISAHGIDFTKPLEDQKGDVKHEVLEFETYCYACGLLGYNKTCIATIPFFKEIIIMSFSCDHCGYRTSEIKQGGGISEKATRITFKIQNQKDMNRDIFKSDTCIMGIPELDFAMSPGTLGSMYTTVEGLVDKIAASLRDNNPFGVGDSATNNKYLLFLDELEQLKSGEKKFTLILDDPLSNCFVYNPFAPEKDPQMTIEVYERTWEQNEELGINDMNC